MSIKLSIIVPLYNVERYLAECLHSLTSQQMEALEIILVDDCSTDNSLAIATSLAQKDARIKILRQDKNCGAGGCRNLGLQHAQGEYVWFVDSDDAATENLAAEHLYQTASSHNCDVLAFNALMTQTDRDELLSAKPLPSYSFLSAFTTATCYEGRNQAGSNYLEDNLNCTSVVWMQLYRRSFLEENHYTFLENTIHQDAICILWLLKAQKILTLPFLGYYYRASSASSSRRKVTPFYFENGLRVIAQIDELLAQSANQLSPNDKANSLIRIMEVLYNPELSFNYCKFKGHTAKKINSKYSTLLLNLKLINGEDCAEIAELALKKRPEDPLLTTLFTKNLNAISKQFNQTMQKSYANHYIKAVLKRRLALFIPEILLNYKLYLKKIRFRFLG